MLTCRILQVKKTSYLAIIIVLDCINKQKKSQSHVNNPSSTRDDMDLRDKKKKRLRSPAIAEGQLLFQLQTHFEGLGLRF